MESNLFSTVLGEKRRGSGLPTNRGIYKKIICNPTHHKMLLLTQKDNINRSRSRKLSWQFSLLRGVAILTLRHPKVRRATSLLAQDDTLKGLLREPRTNGRPMVAPTSEIWRHVAATDQTKIYMSLFTIKNQRNTRWPAVRVFPPRICAKLSSVMSLPFQTSQTLVGNIGEVYV